jgi:hypothetical protein
MLSLLPGIALFIYCVFSFCRETKLDYLRYLEQDRLGDEHMLREIEKYMAAQLVEQRKERK